MYPIIISTVAGLSTVLGSLLIFLKIPKVKINKFLCFCLSFSLAVMISISVFDLIPVSFISLLKVWSTKRTITILFVSFILSFLVISSLDFFVQKSFKNDNLYHIGILSMIVLMLHNLPEGIATFLSSYQDTMLGLKLAGAIMLHNIPEGISIAIPIYYATGNKKRAIGATIFSGLSEPLGAILAYVFLKSYITDTMISLILVVVAGLMITLAINEILPKALKYQEMKTLKFGLLMGIIIVLLNIFMF